MTVSCEGALQTQIFMMPLTLPQDLQGGIAPVSPRATCPLRCRPNSLDRGPTAWHVWCLSQDFWDFSESWFHSGSGPGLLQNCPLRVLSLFLGLRPSGDSDVGDPFPPCV